MDTKESTGLRALLLYAKDPRFYVPVAVLIAVELFMQFGYRDYLDPQSYADNINRITATVKSSQIKPDLLVLGTSVAYQGIQVRALNERLGPLGITAQSGACQGAKLMTQHAIYRSLRSDLPKLKYVVLVSEVSFPWTARRHIDEPNLSMISQLPRRVAYGITADYGMKLAFPEHLYLNVRSITYRRDLRAFALSPLKRLKRLHRRNLEPPSPYVYENREIFRMSAYKAQSLDECMENARRGIPPRGPDGQMITDRHHRNAVLQTCAVGRDDPMSHPGGPQWTRLFFNRLALMHAEIRRDGSIPIVVFMPYSDLIRDLNADHRLTVWKNYLGRMYGKDEFHLLDLRRSLDGPRNGDYYYDTIHLNSYGAARFTEILSRHLIELIGRLEKRRP